MEIKVALTNLLSAVVALLVVTVLLAVIIYVGGLLYNFNMGCFITYIALLLASGFSAKLGK